MPFPTNGFLIPVFFISSGVRLDLSGLLASPSALIRMPLFLLALLIVRGVPALLSIRRLGRTRSAASGLLQATSLPFIVTASQIGMAAGLMTPITAAALVCAGLLSVLIFQVVALGLLRSAPAPAGAPQRSVSGLEKSGPFGSPGRPLFVAPGWFKAKRPIELLRDSCRLQRRGPRAMPACIGKHVFHQAPRQAPTPPSRDRADRVDPAVLLVQQTPGTGHRQLIVHHHPPRSGLVPCPAPRGR